MRLREMCSLCLIAKHKVGVLNELNHFVLELIDKEEST